MQLKKITTVEAETTDGKRMEPGHQYVMVAGGKTICGEYKGISGKGALMFVGVLPNHPEIKFNIMPSSIVAVYDAEILINDSAEGIALRQEATNED